MKISIDSPIKFRQSIFALFYKVMQFEIAYTLVIGLLMRSADEVEFVFGLFLFCLLSLFTMIGLFLSWNFYVYKIHGSNLEIERGILYKNVKTFSVEHIQEVIVTQSLLGKILNYGDLRIDAPTINQTIKVKRVDSVWKMYDILNKFIQDNEKDAFVITN